VAAPLFARGRHSSGIILPSGDHPEDDELLVDLPGFYPAVYPYLPAREDQDCLSRTEHLTEQAGTLDAYLYTHILQKSLQLLCRVPPPNANAGVQRQIGGFTSRILKFAQSVALSLPTGTHRHGTRLPLACTRLAQTKIAANGDGAVY
jgi:hypothetical protein